MKKSDHGQVANQEQKIRDEACNEALKDLEEWRRNHLVAGLSPLIWDYEYKQAREMVSLLRTLIENLKGPDPREHE